MIVSGAARNGDDFLMAHVAKRPRRLWDAYHFPGMRPLHTVRGIFGEPTARVITLVRRSKKRVAVCVGEFRQAGTIGGYAGSAISPVATCVSTWRLRSGACSVAVAGA